MLYNQSFIYARTIISIATISTKIKKINEKDGVNAEINPYGKPFEGSAYEFGLKIMEHIENMSAVYDVDRL